MRPCAAVIKNNTMLITEEQFKLLNKASSHIIPILLNQNGIIKLIDSSVYIKKNNDYYLLTALHVTEKHQSENIFIPFKHGSFLNIPSRQICKINQNEIDLCIYSLEEKLDLFIPIDYNLMENCTGIGAKILLSGFPATRTKNYDSKILFENRFI